MKLFLQKFRRDAVAILWLATGVFVCLALFSYRPTDPSLSALGFSQQASNWCGLFGSFLSDALYQLFGLAAWALPLTSVRMGISSLGKKPPSVVGQMIWGALSMLLGASLFALHLPKQSFYGGQIASGGFFGSLVVHGLIRLFNFAGVAIILWSLACIYMVFYSDRGVAEIASFPFLLLQKIRTGLLQKIKTAAQATWKSFVNTLREDLKKASATAAKEERSADAKIEEYAQPKDLIEEAEERQAAQLEVEPARRRVALKTKIERRIENWKLPELSMLEDPPASRTRVDEREIQKKSEVLLAKLLHFKVQGEIRHAKPGPAVTMYEFKPDADVKISRITELADDLSLALSSESVRIIAPIPGRDVVGIETSNSSRETVYLKDILAQDSFWSDKFKLPVALGRQADGDPRVVDLRKMPHLMVAGTTGSGKSVFVVSTVTGLLFRHSPKTLRLLLIDPKQVDLAAFSKIPHLLMPPIRDAKKAVTALKWAIREMDKRYRSMSRFAARDLEGFNAQVEKLSKTEIEQHEKFNEELEQKARHEQYYFTSQPYILIVVEEFGDLMAVDKANVEQVVVRLAQMARACGMHLILAMQSPRKDVVTGLIKTNIPGRISFKVASKMDSRIILDDTGAERLLANGDMLYLAPGVAKPQRHHGPWVTEKEILSIMDFWAEQGEPQFDPLAMKALEGTGGGFDMGTGETNNEDGFGEGGDNEYDERYDEILAWTSAQKEVSASLLQRKFKLGYPRAARMIEIFEKEGVVGPAQGSKPRQVLVRSFEPQA